MIAVGPVEQAGKWKQSRSFRKARSDDQSEPLLPSRGTGDTSVQAEPPARHEREQCEDNRCRYEEAAAPVADRHGLERVRPMSRDEHYSPFAPAPGPPRIPTQGELLYEFVHGDTRVPLRARRPRSVRRPGAHPLQRRALHEPHVCTVALHSVLDATSGRNSLGRGRAEGDRAGEFVTPEELIGAWSVEAEALRQFFEAQPMIPGWGLHHTEAFSKFKRAGMALQKFAPGISMPCSRHSRLSAADR